MGRKRIGKPYYRIKGQYEDGRNRLVIEWEEGMTTKSKALPKPEELIKILP
jgi:hypothetical protein